MINEDIFNEETFDEEFSTPESLREIVDSMENEEYLITIQIGETDYAR